MKTHLFAPNQYSLRPYKLPLIQPVANAKSTSVTRQGILTIVRNSKSIQGVGDCTPQPQMGTEDYSQAEQFIGKAWRDDWQKAPDLALHPASRYAMETACLDLDAKIADQPLAQKLHPNASGKIRVNALAPTLEKSVLLQLVAQGFELIKVKVGILPVELELRKIQEALEVLGTVRLRLDANGAWTFPQAAQMLKGLEGLPIESIEEPLSNPELHQLVQLQSQTKVPIALDESLNRFPLDEVLRSPIRRLVLKPGLLGGLLPTFELARRASEAGKQLVVTSQMDSAAGVWACVQLASAVDALCPQMVHGLATSALFRYDLGESPSIHHGAIELPDRPGTGFIPHEPDLFAPVPSIPA